MHSLLKLNYLNDASTARSTYINGGKNLNKQAIKSMFFNTQAYMEINPMNKQIASWLICTFSHYARADFK